MGDGYRTALAIFDLKVIGIYNIYIYIWLMMVNVYQWHTNMVIHDDP